LEKKSMARIAPRVTVFLVFLSVLSGCTMIQPVPGAEAVVVGDPFKIENCALRGSATASVVHKVGFLERLPEVVEDDLARVAANTAVELGGDTIVPQGAVSEGRRKFSVYKCRR
jgi:hypothetical protein